MTPEQASLIEQAEKLDREATPGPWSAGITEADYEHHWVKDSDGDVIATDIRPGDHIHIAEARTLVPDLAAELKRARDENAKLRDRLAKCEPLIAHVRSVQSDLENDHKDRAWDSLAELRTWKLPPEVTK